MGDDSFFRMADIAETKRHIHGFSSAVRAEFESILCCFENFDSNGTAWTLEHMGYGAYSLGELDEAQRYYEWSLHTEFPFREERDSANVLFGLAQLALAREDMAEAIALSSRSLGIYQRSGNVAMKIWPLIVLGYAALHQQDYQTAHTHFFECLKISQRTNDPKACEVGLEAQAALMGAQEHGARASRLLGAAAALREKKQLRQDVPDRMRTESLLTAQRATLGESTFAAAWEAGRAMTGEEAVAYALES